MNLNFLTRLFSRPQPNNPPPARPNRHAAHALAGRRARQTIQDSSDFPFTAGLFSITRRPNSDTTWRSRNLDSKTLDKISVDELVTLLTDISPEISRALWDFIRMVNPGYSVEVLRPGTEEEDSRAKAVVDAFFATLKALYGASDIQINRLVYAGFIRGAFFSELVLDEQGRNAVDLATPDPESADFRKVKDPIRGTIWELGQWQTGQWISFADVPTVSYMPIDPPPNSPYGRPLISAAIFTAIFLIGLLHDLRRVIAQQGYPRIDLSILTEMVEKYLVDQDTSFEDALHAVEEQIKTVYNSLEPDDAYIHSDIVTVNNPVGALSSDLSAIDSIISALERMAVRALKTMPLLLGLADGGGETFANRQWELHAAGIKSIQHLLESQMEQHLTILLQAQGLQATVKFRFAELRASEMLRDAQTEAMQFANLITAYNQGWISQEEAALTAVGHPPDQPGPRRQPVAVAEPELVQGDGENEEPEAEELDQQRMRLNGHAR